MTQESPEREPEEYRIRWTDHPDAYPDVSHCPSCGEPVDVPWSENPDPRSWSQDEVRCDQCDRDLRLPSYAIKEQLCLLCKIPEADADESVTYRRLETGERLCSNCTEDLRAFKYELAVQQFIAEYLTDEHRAAFIEAMAEVQSEYDGDYEFTVDANAKYGRLKPEPQDDLTLEDLVDEESVDAEDIVDELSEAGSSGGDADADGDGESAE